MLIFLFILFSLVSCGLLLWPFYSPAVHPGFPFVPEILQLKQSAIYLLPSLGSHRCLPERHFNFVQRPTLRLRHKGGAYHRSKQQASCPEKVCAGVTPTQQHWSRQRYNKICDPVCAVRQIRGRRARPLRLHLSGVNLTTYGPADAKEDDIDVYSDNDNPAGGTCAVMNGSCCV